MEENSKSASANLPQGVTILPEDISSFVNGMISSNSNLRQAAEVQFDKIPAELKPNFLMKICKSTDATEELRLLSLERLSRLLKGTIHTWSSDHLTPFSEELIEFALSEKRDKLTDTLIDVIAQVTKHSMDLNAGVQSSSTIISFMKQCSATDCPSLRKIALSVIVKVPNLFGKNVSDPRDLVEKCLKDRNATIRRRALEAFFAVINENTIGALSGLLPLTFQTFEEIVMANEDRPSDCPIASLAKLAAKYPQTIRPHLKAVVNVCSRATSKTSERMREQLTLLLDPLLKGHDNSNIDVDISSKIAYFTLHCAPSTTNDVKRAAMHIVHAVPHAFGGDCASALLELFKNRLNDGDFLIRISAVAAFPIFLEKNAKDDEFMKTLCTLLPRIIELAEAQAAEQDVKNNALYDQYNGPFHALDEISKTCVHRVRPHRAALAQACINFLRKLNSGKEETKALTEAESRHLSTVFKIIPRLFQGADYVEYGSDTVMQLGQQLTRLAYSEMNESLRKECIELMERVARGLDKYTSNGSWSEVHEHILNSSRSPRIKALTIRILQHSSRVVGIEDLSIALALHVLLESDLRDPSAEIRRNALRAVAACASRAEYEDFAMCQFLHLLMPTILQLTSSDESAEDVLQCLQEMAESACLSIVHSELAKILDCLCKIVKDTSRNTQIRLAVMESVRGLCCMRRRTMKRDCSHVVPDILSCCLFIMTDLDESTSAWANADYDSGRDRNARTLVGETALVAVLTALKEVATDPLLILIDGLLHDADWKKRHAALMAIGVHKKGLPETARLEIATRITPLLKDPNCRIRSASALALLRIGQNCPPNLHKTLLEIVILPLISSLEDTSVPRVAAQSAAALAQFCKEYPQTISPHLDAIVRSAVGAIEVAYQKLLSDGKTCCLAQMIELLCSLKDTGGSHYVMYYDRVIGPVRRCLDAPAQFLTLHTAALTCFSLIASAVGKGKCLEDVTQVMRALLSRFNDLLLSDEDEFPSSFARLVSIMGDSFSEFLPVAMPPVIAAIQASTVVIDENGEVHHLHDIDLMLRKGTACKLVVRLASILGGSFLPYVMELAQLAIAHLTMQIYRTDREWAAEILPALLASAKARGGEELVAKLWTAFARVFKISLNEEGMQWAWRELEANLIRSLGQCIELIECLSDEDRQEFNDLMKMKKEVNEERKERLGRMEEEMDEDDIENRREEERVEKEIGASIEAVNLRIKKYF